jgi:DHA2 family multidrug resistance protein-like MFS transporter
LSRARSREVPITPSKPSTADAEPSRDGLPVRERRLAYLALASATTMAVLDGSIANTALPQIARDLQASPAASIWVVNGFQLAVTMSLLPLAALGQLRGPARVYRVGIVVFIVGSLLCALAHTLELLVLARVLQGFGAAAIMAIAPALLREVFPRAELGRALGINALVVATSSAAGPTLGGIVLAVATWPWLFAINIPIGIANVVLNRALPPDAPNGGGRLDIASVVTSALGLSLLIYGLDGFARAESAWTIALRLVIGAGSLAWFARRQFTLAQPMIALDLFRIPAFSFAGATSFATFTAQGLAYVALPFFFQEALGHTPLASGLLLTSWPLSIAVVAPLAGRLSDRYSVGVLATAGLAVLTLGLGLYATLSPAASVFAIVMHGVVCGLGFGFFQSPNNRELIGSAPRSKSASAAGLLAAIRVSGQTLGASLVAIVFGAWGASVAVGSAARTAVLHAVPGTLWIACAFAGLATLASGLRLRGVSEPRATLQV